MQCKCFLPVAMLEPSIEQGAHVLGSVLWEVENCNLSCGWPVVLYRILALCTPALPPEANTIAFCLSLHAAAVMLQLSSLAMMLLLLAEAPLSHLCMNFVVTSAEC